MNEMRRLAARLFRVITGTQTLAQEDDRRALIARLARVPDECVALRLQGGSVSASEFLDHLERRLMQPYVVSDARESVKRRKLRVARLMGRFCDGRGASGERSRAAYRQISDELSACGL